jgi:hypothetical protein
MAKPPKMLLIDRVAQVRSRLLIGQADGASYEAMSRLTDLKRSLKSLEDSDSAELFRYFPVAAIAVLEAHFRAVVTMIVNKEGEYSARGIALVSDKLKASEVITSIHKKTVSIGEVVAYSLPFSSLAHLEEVYSSLLGQSFKQLASSAKDAHFLRNEVPGVECICKDVSGLWADLHRTFHDRHVLAHESATQFVMSYEKAAIAVGCVSMVIDLTEAILWSTVWKDEPLTQAEMNNAAWRRYKVVRASLAHAIRARRKVEDSGPERSRFRRLHFVWRSWAFEWCEFCADRFKGGSIRPLIHASELIETFEARIKQVSSVTGY